MQLSDYKSVGKLPRFLTLFLKCILIVTMKCSLEIYECPSCAARPRASCIYTRQITRRGDITNTYNTLIVMETGKCGKKDSP